MAIGNTQLEFGPGPLAVGKDRDNHEPCEEGHEAGRTAIVALVAMHVLAAPYHHFILSDGVLRRSNGRYALCTMCIGVGQGIAMIIERA